MDLLYSFNFKKGVLVFTILLFCFGITTKQTHALSFSSASATLTTSRPSAATPLSAAALLGDSILSVFNNGSRFLASDSAKIIRPSGGPTTGFNVASQSADLLKVFFTNTSSTVAGAGADILVTSITSVHTVSFTPNSQIPSGGKILITFPGTFSNLASPSATTFSFNNLVAANVKSFPATACNSIAISNSGIPTITCTTSGIQPVGTNVKIFIGCSAITAGACTTEIPTLINPTKSATSGTADIWRVGIASTDASNNPIDSSTVAIGTVESVTVRATIDPSLTFTIAGVANGAAVNLGNATGCLQVETTNSGGDATATDVGLGSLSIVPAITTKLNNISAQLLTVATNGANGYSITSTSSGSLSNPSTGFSLLSSTSPLVFPATGNFFGMHACGTDTDLPRWTSGAPSTLCNTYISGSATPICKYAWPNNAPMLVANRATGPVGTGASCFAATGCGLTSVSYAATQDVSLPPGIYQSVITYVATASF